MSIDLKAPPGTASPARMPASATKRRPDETPSPARSWLQDDSLATGMVLSACAGSLDAFSYLGHGHAFASFMTGNLVLLGIDIASGGPLAIYAAPLAAYFVGVAIARGMERGMERVMVGRGPLRDRIGRPKLAALAIEAAMLAVLAFEPFPLRNRVLVSLITMAAAMQNTAFRSIGKRTYNSAFMTGNLQGFSTLIIDGMLPLDRAKLRESLALAAVIASFFAGAVVGGLLTPRLHLLTLLAPAGALALLGLALLLPRPR